jgi:asparagine synthase (glutamine-hydrolysing)
MYAFEKVHLVGLLQRVDMTTMAASVEARVPFVDHRVVEFAFSIPIKYKLKWISETIDENNLLLSEEISEIHDTPKYLLKKVMHPYLSENILYRKKMGFPVPLNKWFGGDFSKEFISIVLNNEDIIGKFINVQNVVNIAKSRDLENDHSLSMKMWMVLNFCFFCQNHQENT